MKIAIQLLLILLLNSCTSVNFTTAPPENGVYRISALENSIFSVKKTLSLELSSENGGQIKQISWNDQKLLATPIQEDFPTKTNSFKTQKVRLMDLNDGLIVADTHLRNSYLFRRSYNLFYDDSSEEYVIEINYLTKNHSDSKSINYQWASAINFKNTPTNLNKHSDSSLTFTIGTKEAIPMKIATSNIKGLKIDAAPNKNHIYLSNDQIYTLGPKEKMTWKVQYRLQKPN